MIIPLNGRITIIDDQIKHARPLMTELSRKQIPFTYYSGDYDSLPEETSNPNDTRVVFLDINLIDDSEHENKVLKARLVPVLKKVIAKNNHPYVLIYWSRHERHKNLIEDEIFDEDLKDRAPIAYLSATKSDYFDFDGSKTEDFDEKIVSLFQRIEKEISKSPAYSYLLEWENKVHLSADRTLQSVFNADITMKDWNNNANYIFSSLGLAFLGKHFYIAEVEHKINAGNLALSSILRDNLEHFIFNSGVSNVQELEFDREDANPNMSNINFNLNISRDVKDISESGVIIEFQEEESSFKQLLHKLISFFGLKMKIKNNKPDISEQILKKEAESEHKRIRSEIKKKWKKIGVVVTPVCDFAQRNKIYDRVVKGLLIPLDYAEYVENSSEAIFTLPFDLVWDEKEYILVLDFRYFITCDLNKEEVIPLFRLRQELLSEIQSRLSRHINRQGILVLQK